MPDAASKRLYSYCCILMDTFVEAREDILGLENCSEAEKEEALKPSDLLEKLFVNSIELLLLSPEGSEVCIPTIPGGIEQ